MAAPKVKPGGKDSPEAVSGRTSVEVMAVLLLARDLVVADRRGRDRHAPGGGGRPPARGQGVLL
ncbi:hypothetical protein GCM10023328_24800 [Modestobacter marinus]|uniref:Uncharacterized protein n=1 Tax=Modestobacter marinus TaxID=477641 RepID=A0ABQ2FWV9_9ACTN|nr:hypothetical protein GCM10011589_18080 [Modestobacter marinus]